MPPKKPAADSADPPAPSAPVEEKHSEPATLRKLAAHPSTATMVKEALKELDSRKGVSSQAIQNYIKQKYPSVDIVRLKHLVRRTLKKGIETGTLVRPANSTVTTGAMGKFRLAPKVKQAKPKTENVDPNVQKVSKAAKDGAKKPKKAAATKKDTATEEAKSQEESKPPKRSKKEKEAATETTIPKVAPAKKPKVAPAKKPKAALAKKPKAKQAAEEDVEEASDSAKTKVAKTKETKDAKETKAGKPPRSKVAKVGSDAPAAKATGKRGKKTPE